MTRTAITIAHVAKKVVMTPFELVRESRPSVNLRTSDAELLPALAGRVISDAESGGNSGAT
jgi:hypothetical protein